jgi:putative peptidoglycan lipid II flippase
LSSTQPSAALAAERAFTRAVESPLVRGGLTIGAGLLTGNVIGFARVALTAYLLGTHSTAVALAVALGPIDALNSLLINSMVFGFVPMLTEHEPGPRTALFRKLRKSFLWVFSALTVFLVLNAGWLMKPLAPGLDPAHLPMSANIMRILALSTLAAGLTAIQCAWLYTERRFAPTAFYQASLNLFTIVCALGFWSWLGVYGFAIGYTVGAWAQFIVTYFASRSKIPASEVPECKLAWGALLAKPLFFLVYASGLAFNVIFTRAYATHAGPGVAAAFEYCMRGVGVPLAILVNPMANSLLPEIARLRSLGKIRDALRLIDKTIGIAALLAICGCAIALVFREPAVRFLFERGNFTPESTQLVSSVFLGLGPALVGWCLIEIQSRSLFALDRPWVPVLAAPVPIFVNALIMRWTGVSDARLLGMGASVGLIIGFIVLQLLARRHRAG